MGLIRKINMREMLRQVMTVEDTPHRIGLAFAIGVFISTSFLIGLHTVMAITIPHVFRLSKKVTLAGALINNPWTIVPLFSFCLWVGLVMTGTPLGVHEIDWAHIGAKELMTSFGHLIWPFVIGTTVVGVLGAVAGYYLMRHAVERARGRS